MNESKCLAPSLSASRVSSSNTAQISCMSRANTRISELCASLVRPIIISDKNYVERLYTIFITFCETFFHAFYVTEMRYDTISVCFIKSCFVANYQCR